MSPLLQGVLLVLYLIPVAVVLVRRPAMSLFIVALDILLGWSIVGWGLALFLALTLPRPNPALQATATAVGPAPGLLGPDQRPTTPSMDFIRDPLTVGLLTFFAPVAYFYWWFFQFFRLAQRENFPRARSFLGIFLPFYNYVVIYRMAEDLERRLPSGKRGHFSAGAVVAMIVVGYMLGVVTLALRQPFVLGFLLVSFAFFAAATSSLQFAANAYLRATYRAPRSSGTRWDEVAAMMIGVTLLGLDVTGATLGLTSRRPPVHRAVVAASSPITSATPSAGPTVAPSQFPISKSRVVLISEPGDFIGKGKTRTFDDSNAAFIDMTTTMSFPSVGIHIDTGPAGNQPGITNDWFVVFAAPAGDVAAWNLFRRQERRSLRRRPRHRCSRRGYCLRRPQGILHHHSDRGQ